MNDVSVQPEPDPRRRAANLTLAGGVLFVVGGPYGFIKSHALAGTGHDIASHVMFVLAFASLGLGFVLCALGLLARQRRPNIRS